MKIIAIVAALFLAGCSTVPPGKGEWDRSGAPVTACYPQDRDQCAAQPELPWCKKLCPK